MDTGGGERKCWKEAIVYQLYPRSFRDIDADDGGDLKGITQRLDDQQLLAIEAIWLNPICASPNEENGYVNINSDYRAIMKEMAPGRISMRCLHQVRRQ